MRIIIADTYSSSCTALWELLNEEFMILIRLEHIFLLMISLTSGMVFNFVQYVYSLPWKKWKVLLVSVLFLLLFINFIYWLVSSSQRVCLLQTIWEIWWNCITISTFSAINISHTLQIFYKYIPHYYQNIFHLKLYSLLK